MGVSAYHLLRGQHVPLFKSSFRLAATFALIFAVLEIFQGHIHGAEVAKIQPTKLAAMEALWETQAYAPQVLFLIPDEKNERNRVEIGRIPGALSMLAFHTPSATVKGLKDFPPEDRPPVTITFLAFRTMVGLGFLFVALSVWAWLKRHNPEDHPLLLKAMLLAIPLPYIALQAGWIVTEVGRQPWIVYNLMRTKDAVSPIAASQVAFSFTAMVLLYTVLGIAGFFLIIQHIRKGPEAAPVPVHD